MTGGFYIQLLTGYYFYSKEEDSKFLKKYGKLSHSDMMKLLQRLYNVCIMQL
jgi:hypothetical protein